MYELEMARSTLYAVVYTLCAGRTESSDIHPRVIENMHVFTILPLGKKQHQNSKFATIFFWLRMHTLMFHSAQYLKRSRSHISKEILQNFRIAYLHIVGRNTEKRPIFCFRSFHDSDLLFLIHLYTGSLISKTLNCSSNDAESLRVCVYS